MKNSKKVRFGLTKENHSKYIIFLFLLYGCSQNKCDNYINFQANVKEIKISSNCGKWNRIFVNDGSFRNIIANPVFYNDSVNANYYFVNFNKGITCLDYNTGITKYTVEFQKDKFREDRYYRLNKLDTFIVFNTFFKLYLYSSDLRYSFIPTDSLKDDFIFTNLRVKDFQYIIFKDTIEIEFKWKNLPNDIEKTQIYRYKIKVNPVRALQCL
ncbi:MAG TPA: hypothetical protein PKK00_03750 [Bacteroidales bacterium]|nr:hypothetical protein [Bacteroidales bacterium]HPS16581.1 hypothetical protein [Bacteroidales bacterium]